MPFLGGVFLTANSENLIFLVYSEGVVPRMGLFRLIVTVSTLQIPFVVAPIYAAIQSLLNDNSLYHSQPSPPSFPSGIVYYLLISCFPSRAYFSDLQDERHIQIRREINFYFLVLMQISLSMVGRIKTRLFKMYVGWHFIAGINRRYDPK